jgi:hypothetical protein
MREAAAPITGGEKKAKPPELRPATSCGPRSIGPTPLWESRGRDPVATSWHQPDLLDQFTHHVRPRVATTVTDATPRPLGDLLTDPRADHNAGRAGVGTRLCPQLSKIIWPFGRAYWVVPRASTASTEPDMAAGRPTRGNLMREGCHDRCGAPRWRYDGARWHPPRPVYPPAAPRDRAGRPGGPIEPGLARSRRGRQSARCWSWR